MCGIILVGGKHLGQRESTFFDRALICDTFRGYHSTGAFVGYKRENGPTLIASHKQAIEGWDFVRSDDWKAISSVSRIVPPATVSTTIYPKFKIGHNRHATMGAKNDANAHPFQHGAITLVHNGSLVDQSHLPDSTMFEVDSENICYSIDKQGIEKTIQQLDGAFTLVWHDSRNETLNIIRNEERPFHLLETESGSWYGASEEDMLMWLYGRAKYAVYNTHVPPVKRHFECEVGVQYIFDVKDGNFELKEEVKHELPIFPVYSAYRSSSSYGSSYGSRSYGLGGGTKPTHIPSPSSRFAQNLNETLSEKAKLNGLKKHDYIQFLAFQFDPYPGRPTHGKLTGMIDGHEIYVEIVSHGFEQKDYTEQAYMYGRICTAFETYGTVTIIVDKCTYEKPEEESDVQDDPMNDQVQTLDGAFYTRHEWERSHHSACGWCNQPIPFEQADTCNLFSGAYICSTCYEDIEQEMSAIDTDDELSVDDAIIVNPKLQDNETITETCVNCNREKELSSMSAQEDGWCKECYNAYKSPNRNQIVEEQSGSDGVIQIRQLLKNGMRVTYQQWLKLRNCFHCKKEILWKDAPNVGFIGSQPVCHECEDKLI